MTTRLPQPEQNTPQLNMTEAEEFSDLWFLLFTAEDAPRKESDLPPVEGTIPRDTLHLLRAWAEEEGLSVETLRAERAALGVDFAQ
jgi:hypothetical protein